MGKQKPTTCPGINTCLGSQVEDIYETFCKPKKGCGYCGHFTTRNLIKENHKIIEPYRVLVRGKHKWMFAIDKQLEEIYVGVD